MTTETPAPKKGKSSARLRADEVKPYLCKNLIAVIEDPHDIRNIGTVIRNVNALGVEKAYIVDTRKALPDDWQEMREQRSLSKISVSANKWTFVKRFDSTESCINHLAKESLRFDRHFAPRKGEEERDSRRGRLHRVLQTRGLVRK